MTSFSSSIRVKRRLNVIHLENEYQFKHLQHFGCLVGWETITWRDWGVKIISSCLLLASRVCFQLVDPESWQFLLSAIWQARLSLLFARWSSNSLFISVNLQSKIVNYDGYVSTDECGLHSKWATLLIWYVYRSNQEVKLSPH